ncbi:MAG: glycoside-pentoside-hexuronide (GPH):cation symporter [Lachnospiraceae bacterium]|jgi:GPH family glycoside/pentoside/hexuronide:cation symporter|nr:glycoside-pentoside-hexuronide (GPH):cation symporter [Lachnospiraceae bacterium]
MEEKKYLKWYNKVGFGAGSWGSTMCYMLITAFVMIYLTDTVGLNAGIVGTLIMVSKVTDGISDIFFGHIIDKTKSKMGKARPWMFFAYPGCMLSIILLFSIPTSWGTAAQYVYFFIWYTMFNTIFFTACNIAYSTLTSLITRNNNERVQMGCIRYIFATATYIILASVTMNAVSALGGGAVGWRNVTIIYAVIGFAVNSLSVFSVKELPDEDTADSSIKEKSDSASKHTAGLGESFKLLFRNKFFIIICLFNIVSYLLQGIGNSIGVYYTSYVLKNVDLLGAFTAAGTIPIVIGLLFTPFLVKKLKSIYKVNLYGAILSTLARVVLTIFGYMGNLPGMLTMLVFVGLFQSPITATMYTMISASGEYTYKTTGKKIDGMMFSCDSFGAKVGSGLGSALTGWLLAAGGYVANAASQTSGAVSMLQFMFFIIPLIGAGITVLLLSQLTVEKANARIDSEKAQTAKAV